MPAGSSPIATYSKDPVALLDYTIDWSAWLGEETIVTASWTVPAGIANAGEVFSSTTTTVFLSSGTSGTSYSVYVTITTATRTEKRTIRVNCIDR